MRVSSNLGFASVHEKMYDCLLGNRVGDCAQDYRLSGSRIDREVEQRPCATLSKYHSASIDRKGAFRGHSFMYSKSNSLALTRR